jgi:hypothetical protein
MPFARVRGPIPGLRLAAAFLYVLVRLSVLNPAGRCQMTRPFDWRICGFEVWVFTSCRVTEFLSCPRQGSMPRPSA